MLPLDLHSVRQKKKKMDIPLDIAKGALEIVLFAIEIKGIPAEVEEHMGQMRLFNNDINRLVSLRDANKDELPPDRQLHHQEVINGAQKVLQEACTILVRCDPDIVDHGRMSLMSRLSWKIDVSSEFKSILPRVAQYETRVTGAIQEISFFNYLHPVRSEAMRTLRESEQMEREAIAKEDDIGALLRSRTGSFYNPPLPPKRKPLEDKDKQNILGRRGEQPQSLPSADPATPRLGGRRSQFFKKSPKPIATDAGSQPKPRPMSSMPLAAVGIPEEEDAVSVAPSEKKGTWWRKSSSLSRSSSDASSQSRNQPQVLSHPTSPTDDNTSWHEKQQSPQQSPRPDLRHRMSMLSFKRSSLPSFPDPAASPATTVSSLSRTSSGRTTATHASQCNCGARSPTSPTSSYLFTSPPTSCASTPNIPRADLAGPTWSVYGGGGGGGDFYTPKSTYFGLPSRPQRPVFVSLEDRMRNGDYQTVAEDDEEEYAELGELVELAELP